MEVLCRLSYSGGVRDDNKVLRAALLVTVTTFALSCASANGSDPEFDPLVAHVTFSTADGEVDAAFLEIADTREERARGLMGRPELDPDEGMVFVFEGPTSGGFWMKNTLVPLSIAFWGPDEQVIEILDMEPCRTDDCPTYEPDGSYTHALEMPQGWFERNGIEPGDKVELRLLTS
jgi:uncharacterized membrane protein (UPF0127 family)